MGFKIGDVVRLKDGDGRPHKIVDIKVHLPISRYGKTFFEFRFEDGSGDAVDTGCDNLQYYNGEYRDLKINYCKDFIKKVKEILE